MQEIIKVANDMGFSDADVAEIAGVDISTVRSWLKPPYTGFKNSAIKLLTRLNRSEPMTQRDDQNSNMPQTQQPRIECSVEETQFYKELRKVSEKAKKFGVKVTFEYDNHKG